MGRFLVVYDYNYKAIIDLILYVKTTSKVAHSNLFCVKVLLNFMMIHQALRGIDMICSAFFSLYCWCLLCTLSCSTFLVDNTDVFYAHWHVPRFQLVILMALAKGKSEIRTGPLTFHRETAIHIAHLLTG